MRHTLIESASVQYSQGDPLACYELWRGQPFAGDRLLLVDFTLSAYWLDGQPQLPLTALYLHTATGVSISVTDADLYAGGLAVVEQYARWSKEHGFSRYQIGDPVALVALVIPKPWGQEIWYTGVERRGLCRFNASGGETPIPWLQAAVPCGALGSPGEALVLLKILDPLPEPITGDLYFELHEEKQEVYVITHVDKTAWPDGTGYIRMGFAPQRLQQFAGDDLAFRAAYLEAVQNYEVIRREIDALPEGQIPDTAVQTIEAELRREMDSYSHLSPLQPGDVVKVPLLTPHSLQHGVRSIEFQTPVYERQILSFAQKVLTQDHWDTATAVEKMQLEPKPPEAFEVLEQGQGLLVERIVDFSDFEVHRVRLSGTGALSLAPLTHYALVIVVEGELRLGEAAFEPEQAVMLPREWSGRLISTQAASSLVILLALPRN